MRWDFCRSYYEEFDELAIFYVVLCLGCFMMAGMYGVLGRLSVMGLAVGY